MLAAVKANVDDPCVLHEAVILAPQHAFGRHSRAVHSSASRCHTQELLEACVDDLHAGAGARRRMRGVHY